MDSRIYTFVTGLIFFLVAMLHFLRLLLGWEAVIGGWVVPKWFSGAGLLVAGFLSYAGFRLCKKG